MQYINLCNNESIVIRIYACKMQLSCRFAVCSREQFNCNSLHSLDFSCRICKQELMRKYDQSHALARSPAAIFTRRNKSREGVCLRGTAASRCMCASSAAETKNRGAILWQRALASAGWMRRDSNYLSLSRPQTQLVQRAQWAQYPVEEIAMRDWRSSRGRRELSICLRQISR